MAAPQVTQHLAGHPGEFPARFDAAELFAIEDAHLAAGTVASDFVLLVAKVRE